jgi:dienelactone hydrolase
MQPFADDKSLFGRHGAAALDVLRSCPNLDPNCLGAIGFCWGGFAVLELACFEKLACVAAFHPGLSIGPISRPDTVSASVLVCVGDRDPYVPMKEVTEFMDLMHDHRVDCQILLLTGAPHSFTNPEPYAYETGTAGVGYDEKADRRSWAAMCRLFAERLPLA